jgi:hypothetical protein
LGVDIQPRRPKRIVDIDLACGKFLYDSLQLNYRTILLLTLPMIFCIL